jgi:hypothetical protein
MKCLQYQTPYERMYQVVKEIQEVE